jgi:hypothetical protein
VPTQKQNIRIPRARWDQAMARGRAVHGAAAASVVNILLEAYNAGALDAWVDAGIAAGVHDLQAWPGGDVPWPDAHPVSAGAGVTAGERGAPPGAGSPSGDTHQHGQEAAPAAGP